MSERPLQVLYLLEDTALFGGVKVVLHQAELLRRRGYRTAIASPRAQPDWYDLPVAFYRVSSFSPAELPPADLVVATFWTTIAPALASGAAALHYCQGFEGSYLHNRQEHPAIAEAYAQPLPAIAVSPHLAELVRVRFGRPARVVPPALEPFWRPRTRLGPRRTAKILITNPFENDWKGVSTGLEAVRILRRGGIEVHLIRLSQWPLGERERALLAPDEYHHHIPPPAVARLMAGCDLLLAPSWEQEGFGLPVLEAMACGLPVVGSQIEAFAYAGEAVLQVPPRDPAALAEMARHVLEDRGTWRRQRRAGLRIAARFSEQVVAGEAEAAVRWAVQQGRTGRQD